MGMSHSQCIIRLCAGPLCIVLCMSTYDAYLHRQLTTLWPSRQFARGEQTTLADEVALLPVEIPEWAHYLCSISLVNRIEVLKCMENKESQLSVALEFDVRKTENTSQRNGRTTAIQTESTNEVASLKTLRMRCYVGSLKLIAIRFR